MRAAATSAPHAGAVRARARVARRSLLLARLAESLHIGGAAALLALVLVVICGGRTDRLSSAGVALLCGTLVAVTWAVEHRRAPRAVAQLLDRRLELRGEFLTAWEHDGTRRGGPVAELLVERAARQVPGRTAARAVLPHSWPALAAPFLVGALLATLVAGGDPAQEVLREQRARVAAELGQLAGAQDGAPLDPEQERALRDLVRSAAALAERGSPASTAPERDALVREMRELGESVPGGSELASRLDELAGRLEADDRGARGGGFPADHESGNGSGGRPLAPGGGDGTMVGREPGPGTAPGPAARPEAAWVDPGALPPDLLRILDDWNATQPGDTGR